MWSVCSCLQYLNWKCIRSWFLFKLFTDLITSACCISKHEVFKPLCEIRCETKFLTWEISDYTPFARSQSSIQVMHLATGDCSMKYQICWELMFRVMVRIYGLPSGFRVRVTAGFRAAMSKPNDLLGQNVCHCLDQSCTLKAISMRVAHWMTNFDLRKLHLA